MSSAGATRSPPPPARLVEQRATLVREQDPVAAPDGLRALERDNGGSSSRRLVREAVPAPERSKQRRALAC